MKIEIIPEEKIVGEMDLAKFEEVMKSTPLNLEKAITDSVTIFKNKKGWKTEYIIRVLLSELDWGCFFMNFKHKISDKLRFRMVPIIYQDKLEYKKYAKSSDFRKMILTETKKSGSALILINSLNPNPEHNLDIWLSKTIFPYPESNWKKKIVDEK